MPLASILTRSTILLSTISYTGSLLEAFPITSSLKPETSVFAMLKAYMLIVSTSPVKRIFLKIGFFSDRTIYDIPSPTRQRHIRAITAGSNFVIRAFTFSYCVISIIPKVLS